ncbi:MAG: crotonase, partial [Gammaproteobacteria bacterium]|nr:crotonase [Gammaproteobacteria bacterium]
MSSALATNELSDMSSDNMFEHWSIETDEDGVAWLGLDKANTATNVLSHDVMHELSLCIDALDAQQPVAAIIYSKKTNGFIAGADIKEFMELKTTEQAHKLIRNGQLILERLENLPFPTVAMINGFALGGGMELALACTRRIVVEDDSVRLGLPEVRLGIHPGFGGTVRTTQLMSPLAALDMMLTGRGLRPQQARRLGLVDQAVPARHLKRAAKQLALKKKSRRQRPWQHRLLNSSPMRRLLAMIVRSKTAAKARKEHYPAPFAVIDLWRDYGGDPATMYLKEAASIAQLMMTPTSRQLVRVFLLQNRLKGLGRSTDFKPKHVHVIGAGVMGGDIASWCALRGLTVTLQDREPKYLA